MRPLDTLRYALGAIRARGLESALVALGVALGVGVIASTLALNQAFGVTRQSGREALRITVHVVEEEWNRDTPVRKISQTMDPEGNMTVDDIALAKAVAPDIAYGYLHFLLGEPTQDGKKVLPTSAVVTGEFFEAQGLSIAEGAVFTTREETEGAQVAVLGARRAALLFPEGGAIGRTVTSFGLEYTVVGVLARTAASDEGRPAGSRAILTPDDVAYIPIRSSPVYQKLRYAPALNFVARSPEAVRAAVGELRSYFEGRLGVGAVVVESSLTALEEESAQIRAVVTVLLVFAGSGLLIACVNILNVLLARVARRVRATGISVALGSTRAGVFQQYLLESSILGLVGCAAGIPVAYLFVALMNYLFPSGGPEDPRMAVTIAVLAPAVVAALALNLVFGIYPAWRASGANAADAIRAT